MHNIISTDFFEYNSKPYQAYALDAMENLYDFAADPVLATGARTVLDFAAAKFLVSSSLLRRNSPYRRRQDQDGNFYTGSAMDGQLCRFALYSGELQAFEEPASSSNPTTYAATTSCGFAIREAIGNYRVPAGLLDLVYTPETSYFQIFSGGPSAYANLFGGTANFGMPVYGSTEIYDNEGPFLIAAGGLPQVNGLPAFLPDAVLQVANDIFGPGGYKQENSYSIATEEVYSVDPADIGITVPTVLLPNDQGLLPDSAGNPTIAPIVDRTELFRIQGANYFGPVGPTSIVNGAPVFDGPTGYAQDTNICVAPGFACGKNPLPPACTVYNSSGVGSCPLMVTTGPWQFGDVKSEPVHVYVAMLTAPAYIVPGVQEAFTIGLFEAEPASAFAGGFEEFQQTVTLKNPDGASLFVPMPSRFADCRNMPLTPDPSCIAGPSCPPIQFACGLPAQIAYGWSGQYTKTDNTRLTFSIPGMVGTQFTGNTLAWGPTFYGDYPISASTAPGLLPPIDTTTWPMASGLMNAPDHSGRVTITNPRYENYSCTLDFRDVNNPVRDGCDAPALPPPGQGDTDNDGIVDYADNCPTISNSDQQNTNYVAEYALQVQYNCYPGAAGGLPNGCSPIEGERPQDPHDTAYSAHYQASYPGDVCDTTPATATNWTPYDGPPGIGNSTCGAMNECTCCATVGSGADGLGAGITNCTTNNPCQAMNLTKIDMTSWMSNGNGGGAIVIGSTAPAFCPCSATLDFSDPRSLRQCVGGTNQCILGQDSAFPPSGSIQGAGGWQSITEEPAPGARPEASDLTTYFWVPGEDGDSTSNQASQPNLATFYWDVTNDLARFGNPSGGSLSGVLWAAVRSFQFDAHTQEQDSALPAHVNLRHHYEVMSTSESSSTIANFPLCIEYAGCAEISSYFGPSHVPLWGVWAPFNLPGIPHASDQSVPFLAVSLQGADAFPISEDTGRTHLVHDTFTVGARAVLAQVAVGAAEILVGDDVAYGVPFGYTLTPSIVVQTNTTNVLGGFQSSGRSIASVQPASVGKAADPPDVRAYSALNSSLFSLHLASGGGLLNTADVAGSLGGSPITTSVRLSGALPIAPTAMVWHKGDGSLYVLDSTTGENGGRFRLLRVATSGVSTELWRTRPTHRKVRAFLTAGYRNDLVLSVSSEVGSEVVILGTNGMPILSSSVDGLFLRGAVENATGLTLPFAESSGGARSNLRLEFLPRNQMVLGVCGARWTGGHAPDDPNSPLRLSCDGCGDGYFGPGDGD